MASAFEKGPSPTDALRKAMDGLAKAMRLGGKREEVVALLEVAQALLDKDGPAAALAALAEPHQKAQKQGLQDLELKGLHLAVTASIEQGDAKMALEIGAQLQDLAAKLGETEVADAKRTMARARILNDSMDNALEDANSALSTYRARGNMKEQAVTLLLLGEIYELRGECEDAERRMRSALSLFKEADCWKGAGAALEALVQMYDANGQYKAAKEVAKDELHVFTGRDKSAEAVALRVRVLPYIGSSDFHEALQLAEEGLKRLVALGDRGAEASLTLALATAYANMGRGDDAIAVAKRALSLARKLGARETEKAAMQLLTQIHDAKEMDPPSSSYRAEALGLLYAASGAAKERDVQGFGDAARRLRKLSGFLTKKDVLDAVGPLDQQELVEFFQEQAPSVIVDYVLETARPVKEDGEAAVQEKRPLRCKEADKLGMYGGLRMGSLVYGPRFRQIEAFVPVTGLPVVHAIVRPSSLADDWEQEGWDWNPAVIDAGAHAGFALQQR